MRSPVGYVLKQTPDTLRRLQDMYAKAAEFSYQIWTEKEFTKVGDPSEFLGQPYSCNGKRSYLHNSVNLYSGDESETEGQLISMVARPMLEEYGGRQSYHDKYRPNYLVANTWLEAIVWMHNPNPDDPDDGPDVKPKALPRRVDPSTLEPPGARLLRGLDTVTLLDLVKPHLDAFADELRPLVEGLREEITRLKSEGGEKKLYDINSSVEIKAMRKKHNKEIKLRDRQVQQLQQEIGEMSLEIKRLKPEFH
ncbi:hypothetical protein SBOR_5337 [Sclerotinia borealis F-4128]|uniref:Uncharacterized protein n=1 Tax=Sclerotinia borealis (strain F-4128) TaxID=1432307 RepID=W9CHT8_SCLBF|nr:hypothetical protein SBOR_5337 [Sclerotinia borealis F-4128]